MRKLAWMVMLCLAAFPAARSFAETGDESSSEIELTSPGGPEEMTVESEEIVPKIVAPKPKPKPAPKPKPRPKPQPVMPKSPWEWLVLEDFDNPESLGKDVGALQRTSGAQFSMHVVAPGHDGPQSLVLQGVPSLAEGTVWVWTTPDGHPVDLSAFRGISLWAKASQAAGELRIGVTGGGSVFTSVPLGTDWTELRLDFARDAGRGRFDPAKVTSIVLAVSHEQATGLDVSVDTIAAWRERVPSDAVRLGLNVPPIPGPGDWNTDFRAVNCSGRWSAAEGFVLAFWSGEQPYMHRPVIAAWNDLSRGLKGANAIVAQVRVDPATPAVLCKVTLVEQGGEQFSVVRALPADGPLRLALNEFLWDEIENQRTMPAISSPRSFSADSVSGWRLEILPATERQFRGTVTVKELWAEGKMKPGKRPPLPVRKTVAPAAAAPASAAEPAEGNTDEAAPKPKPAAKPAAAASGDEEIGDEPAAAGTKAPAPSADETSGEAPAAATPAEPAPATDAAPAAPAAPAEAAPAAPANEDAPEATPAAPAPDSTPAPESTPAPAQDAPADNGQ